MHLAAIDVRAEPPKPPATVSVPPVRLEPIFERRAAGAQPERTDATASAGGGGAAGDDIAAAKAAARARARREGAENALGVGPEARARLGLEPSAEELAAQEAAEATSARTRGRLRGAVRRLTAMRQLDGARTRADDPRAHGTLSLGVADDEVEGRDAGVFARQTKAADGDMLRDEVSARRSGVGSVVELCKALRAGVSAASEDLGGCLVGEGGARMLSFVLGGEQGHTQCTTSTEHFPPAPR